MQYRGPHGRYHVFALCLISVTWILNAVQEILQMLLTKRNELLRMQVPIRFVDWHGVFCT